MHPGIRDASVAQEGGGGVARVGQADQVIGQDVVGVPQGLLALLSLLVAELVSSSAGHRRSLLPARRRSAHHQRRRAHPAGPGDGQSLRQGRGVHGHPLGRHLHLCRLQVPPRRRRRLWRVASRLVAPRLPVLLQGPGIGRL